jgi:hypothetical protein
VNALEGAISARPLGLLSLRGKSGAVEAFELM